MDFNREWGAAIACHGACSDRRGHCSSGAELKSSGEDGTVKVAQCAMAVWEAECAHRAMHRARRRKKNCGSCGIFPATCTLKALLVQTNGRESREPNINQSKFCTGQGSIPGTGSASNEAKCATLTMACNTEDFHKPGNNSALHCGQTGGTADRRNTQHSHLQGRKNGVQTHRESN